MGRAAGKQELSLSDNTWAEGCESAGCGSVIACGGIGCVVIGGFGEGCALECGWGE